MARNFAVVRNDPHDLVAISVTNTENIVAVCRCGWTSTVVVVPSIDECDGNPRLWRKYSDAAELRAVGQHLEHVAAVRVFSRHGKH